MVSASLREVEHEDVVFLRMRPVEARQGLHRFDAGEGLVDVHRVQQRLVVPGLELVGADEEAVAARGRSLFAEPTCSGSLAMSD